MELLKGWGSAYQFSELCEARSKEGREWYQYDTFEDDTIRPMILLRDKLREAPYNHPFVRGFVDKVNEMLSEIATDSRFCVRMVYLDWIDRSEGQVRLVVRTEFWTLAIFTFDLGVRDETVKGSVALYPVNGRGGHRTETMADANDLANFLKRYSS
jgi:hypothetical protein